MALMVNLRESPPLLCEPAEQVEIGEYARDGVVALHEDESSRTSTCKGFHCVGDA
jgi:hypothetical protein